MKILAPKYLLRTIYILLIVLFTFLFVCLNKAFAANPVYIDHIRMGGTLWERAYDICVDDDNNLYIASEFNGTVGFDDTGGSDNHTSSGLQDIAITKYNADGSYGWTHTLAGSGSKAVRGIACGDSIVYVSGSFAGTVDFDDVSGDSRTAAGSGDGYAAWFDSDGNYGGTYVVTGGGGSAIDDVILDSDSNLYATGYFSSSCDLDGTSGTDSHSNNGSADFFISKYNFNYTYGWSVSIGGTGYDTAEGIDFNSSDGVYVSGLFNGSVNFDDTGGTDTKTTTNGSGFITKYLSDGSYGWTRIIGGGASEGYNDAYSVEVNTLGSVFLYGYFDSDVDFDDSAGTDTKSSANGSSYLTSFTTSGDYRWTHIVGGGAGDGYADGYARLTSNSLGEIYATGYLDSLADFDDTGGTDVLDCTHGNGCTYFVKYSDDGIYQWAYALGTEPTGSGNAGWGGIALDSIGYLYVSGDFYGTMDFDFGAGTDSRTAYASGDIYVLKAHDDFLPPDIVTESAITFEVGSSVVISGTATDGYSSILIVEYSLDGGSNWFMCMAEDGAFDSTSEAFGCDLGELGAGEYTVLLRTSDVEGNVTSVLSYPIVGVTVEEEDLVETGANILPLIIMVLGSYVGALFLAKKRYL